MSTFKMGFKNLLAFTALLLFWKVCRAQCQTARVEYLNQPYCSSAVQPSSSLVVPAMIKPVITPCDPYIQEPVPTVPGFSSYQNYAPSYTQPMPPIIIEDDNDDKWHHLLYFLIFAMRNRRNCGNGGCGGYNGGCGCGGGCNGGCGGYNGGYYGGCGCGGNCGGACGGYDNGFCGCGNFGGNCNNNCGSGCSYIPYPIPFPLNGPYPYSFPGFGFPDNSVGIVEEPFQTAQGTADINVYIRTSDPGCTCTT